MLLPTCFPLLRPERASIARPRNPFAGPVTQRPALRRIVIDLAQLSVTKENQRLPHDKVYAYGLIPRRF
jgi:hypothetical protein